MKRKIKKGFHNYTDGFTTESLLIFLKNINNYETSEPTKGWEPILLRLPIKLRKILIQELEYGNVVSIIDDLDYPDKGSVFLALEHRFLSIKENPINDPEIHYAALNDPHYWLEVIQLSEDGVRHMLTC
jgi:hypothetical protein